MENFQDTKQQPSKLKSALNYGAVLGLVLMIISLFSYVLELYSSSWISWLSTIILVLGIVWGIKRYRDEELGGYISYGQGVGYGTLVGLFAGIIIAFVSYIYLGFFDDGFIQYTLSEQEKALYNNSGVSAEEAEKVLSSMRVFTSPSVIAVSSLFGQVFFALIISLIAMIFLKKDIDSFEDSI